jgi:hypothetical protein
MHLSVAPYSSPQGSNGIKLVFAKTRKNYAALYYIVVVEDRMYSLHSKLVVLTFLDIAYI